MFREQGVTESHVFFKIVIPVLIALTLVLIFTPDGTDGANSNLFVSAGNSGFNNTFVGPQIIEVVIVDPNISDTAVPHGEPDVTVDSHDLRMVQATDGNWYGYFADKSQAQHADNTVGLPGRGLDYGVFCSQATNSGVLGISYSNTVGVAIPRDDGITNSTNGNTPFSACTGSITTLNPVKNHVVRESKSLNPGGGGVSVGQIGIDIDSWPTIQLFNFTPTGNVKVIYNKGGGPQTTTLTFDSVPSNIITPSLSGKTFQRGSQVNVALTDPQLNIDPTDEDSWTWNTESGNNALFYQAFEENGANDANGGAGLANLISNLPNLMFDKNGKVTVNLAASGTAVAEFDTNADQPVPFLTDGLNSYKKIITFVETSPVTGKFVNFDEFDDSNLDILANAQHGNSATITYNDITKSFEVDVPRKDKFQILFKSGGRTPDSGITQANIDEIKGDLKPDDFVHFLIQFTDLKEKNKFSTSGINILDYVTGNTYIASSKVDDLQKLLSIPEARWTGPLTVDDKIAHALKVGDIGTWTKTKKDRVVLTIYFHRDVNPMVAEQLIDKLDGQRFATVSSIPSITAAFNLEKINEIAQQDSVQYVDVTMPPLSEANDLAREAANVKPLNDVPYDLKGRNVRILIYDSGRVSSEHSDFRDRLTPGDTSPPGLHSTLVGGIVGGDGSMSEKQGGQPNQWAGMAPEVQILSYGQPGGTVELYNMTSDLENDLLTAFNQDADLATMSLAHNVFDRARDSNIANTVCQYLGDYAEVASLIDRTVSNPSSPLIFFEAVGNERYNEICKSYGVSSFPFRTISSPATAKNSIAVGALTSDNSIASMSSFGPTDDGRIKPDITASGCHDNTLGPKSTGTGNYLYWQEPCGTSYTTPVASGATALLIEEWKKIHGPETRPLPHTVKAILIHTATDLGRSGPDYEYGWGALNAKSAIDLIIANLTKPMINTNRINEGDEPVPITFVSDGSDKVKATLVWDDPAATPIPEKTLINNLDLELVDPSRTTYFPLILNPDYPQDYAISDTDTTNNVEMTIGNAMTGTWTVVIKGTAISQDPQEFTLIVSDSIPEPNFENVVTGDDSDDGAVDNLSDVCPGFDDTLDTDVDGTPNGCDTTPNGDSGGSNGGGTGENECIFATAAYGSEMAPQVQQLRETRDDIVMKTQSGTVFMTAFNSVYYTFAPTVAGWEQQNPAFKEIIKITITPLLSTLSILNYINIDSEAKMLTYGIGVILLNIGIYFVAPAYVIIRLKNYLLQRKENTIH